jgi:hypothetical protein
MPTKEPYDVVMRPAIREAVRRGSEKFHVPESVFILQKGRVAYFGASGSAAINYFHSFPQV